MRSIMRRKSTPLIYRLLSAFIAFTFSFTSVVPPSYAQSIASLNLPVPGTMVGPSAAFVPVLLKGMTIHPDNPLQFDFIIDSGNTNFKEDQIKTESQRLVKYFLASMTIPKDDLWVNLSPYEKDRIIPDELGKTELGRDMLAQDYILKQLTASLMYPEKELGKEFWDKVYKQAKEKYGTTEIPVDTFNKVWILPETATVYEHGQTVYIVEAKLKVMLDSDYLAASHNVTTSQSHKTNTGDLVTSDLVTAQVVREVILPAIEKEVNEGQNFAPLRQIYHSLILAKWYKETIKNSLLSKIYIDQKKIAGVNIDDATLKDQIYAQYMEAYKKGVFNYIKEDYDQLSTQPIPRKYFSGGIDRLTNFNLITLTKTSNSDEVASVRVGSNFELTVKVNPQKSGASSPIIGDWLKKINLNKNMEFVTSHPNYLVRWRAAEILGQKGDKTVLPALHQALNDSRAEVRMAAEEAINQINTRNKIGGNKTFSSSPVEEELEIWEKDGTLYYASELPLFHSMDFSMPYGPQDWENMGYKYLGRGNKNDSNQSSSPVSMNDLLNVPAGLIGALHENGQILSVKAGEVFDISFGDYWNQITEFATGHPFITTIGGIVAFIILRKGLHYFWIEHAASNIIGRLKNVSGWEASYLVERLGDLSNKRAVEPLIERLLDRDKDVRKSVAMALGKLKDKSAIGPLMQLLADENRDVHRSAIWALGELGAVEPLIEQLGNSDVRIHYSATIALAKLGDIRALNPLIILLKDEDYFIRKDVAKALGELGNRRATEPLITHLNIEERHDVRMAIIGALAKIGDQKAIGSLETHLSQVSPTLEVEENVEIGTGGAWYTHMRTEDNPEYYVTKNALKRLYKSKNGKRIGAQSSSPVKGRIVDLDAVPTDIVPAERVVINHWTAREKYALSLKKQGEGENTGEDMRDLETARNQIGHFLYAGHAVTVALGDFPIMSYKNTDADSIELGLRKFDGSFNALIGDAIIKGVLKNPGEEVGHGRVIFDEDKLNGAPYWNMFKDLLDKLKPVQSGSFAWLRENYPDVLEELGYPVSVRAGEFARQDLISLIKEWKGEGDAGGEYLADRSIGDLITEYKDLIYENFMYIDESIDQAVLAGYLLRRRITQEFIARAEIENQVRVLFGGMDFTQLQKIRILYEPVAADIKGTTITERLREKRIELIRRFIEKYASLTDVQAHTLDIQVARVQSSSSVTEPNYRGTDLKQNAWIQTEGIPEVRDDQGRLSAPNGEPSNLPGELWKLVRTDTFKKWFGDWENYPEEASKIVDENGEPLVMHHASVEDFTVFRQDKIASRDYRLHGGKPRLQGGLGSGMYFTTRQDVLDGFSDGEKPIIYKLFLNVRNPKVIDQSDFRTHPTWGGLRTEFLELRNNLDRASELEKKIMEQRLGEINRILKEAADKETNEALEAGYDGSMDRPEYGVGNGQKVLKPSKDTYAVVVFKPESGAIKSIDNVGTFDASNSDITEGDVARIKDVVASLQSRNADQSSSPITDREASIVKREAQQNTRDASRDTNDEDVGGIDMNSIDIGRLPAGRQAGVDIQFDPAQLQELIDAGIDGFAPVIINITPLPSVLPLLGLEPANKEEPLEVSSLN